MNSQEKVEALFSPLLAYGDFFSDAQGQLTPQSVVGSGRNSNLKELIFIFLFVVTAAGVVPCGSPKKRPRTSSIVQFIF